MTQIINDMKGNDTTTFGSVVAIGNFDGVHIGHQSLIKLILERAKSKNSNSGILSFEPHPREFFDKKKQNFKIMSLESRREKLSKTGIDFIIELPFNKSVANMEPSAFVEDILHKKFGITHIIIGQDFKFGKARSGNSETLKRLGKPFGIEVEVFEIRKSSNLNISSSRIRDLIKTGEVEAANDLLGSYHSVIGKVQKGEQRGRKLGFPTANIQFGKCIIPRFGVYASSVRILDTHDKKIYKGAASIGTRPTFGINHPNLEVYIFEFDKDIYGLEIEVKLKFFIRPEITFSDTKTLIRQMEEDCTEIKKILTGAKKYNAKNF